MRKKSQSWFVPLLILVAVLWFMGKKDTPPTQVQPVSQGTPNALVSVPAPTTAPMPTPTLDQFVSANKLNLRDQPGGKVISTLKRGDKVQVFEKKNDWTRISIDGQPAKWLSSKGLCSGPNCYVIPEPKSPVEPTAQAPRKQTPTYGSSCSCSSGSVCIGPRGGRYCITSGGNKRYGV
jgi:hypothetical protein